ncbi:BatA domain-containing protein [Pseudoxanthomonas sp. UTMC 1351]|uniref:BatA domain-containing protein n=1 Tax=Pseudoxanthomonas sp. UTMC 1351 TaxID=2695853 RepID=UPI0034CEF92B
MNLALLLPVALAALAALILPLLIHLARRSEQRPTDFAALRWLRQKAKPRHRIRFDEWPLLLSRLLLLALMALWLAKPVLFGSASDAPWVIAVPGVDPSQLRAAISENNTEQRWLAPGFPPLDQAPPIGTVPIASLLRQLDTELPASAKLTVFVPEQLSGADAQRPVLSRTVKWRVLPGTMPTGESPRIAPPSLSVRYAAGRESAVRYLRAAAAAWLPAPPATAQVDNFSAAPVAQPLAADARHLVWLAPGPLPASVLQWIENGGTALLDAQAKMPATIVTTVRWRDTQGAPLVEGAAWGRGRVLRFTRPLRPSDMPSLLETDFPQRLRTLFDPALPAPSRVVARDYAPLTGGASYPLPPRDLQPWLALLIALVLLVERWLASRTKRAVAP